jgi:hypothetical protein
LRSTSRTVHVLRLQHGAQHAPVKSLLFA